MSAEPKRRPAALGRGLNALLGDATPAEGSAAAIQDIPLAYIYASPDQPRRHFDDAAIDELAESITRHGVLQPIILKHAGMQRYEIIAGERRWRAAQRTQLWEIPAIVRDVDDAERFELAIIENIQREQLNAIEEGDAYRRLIDEYGHKADDLAKTVHKSRSHIANLMRLLDLPEAVRKMVADGRLTMGHARALLGIDNAEALAQAAIDEALSVREIEKRARAAKRKTTEPALAAAIDPDIFMLQRQLSDMLGLKVVIAHEGKAGTVKLDYATLDQLDMICQRLSGEKI